MLRGTSLHRASRAPARLMCSSGKPPRRVGRGATGLEPIMSIETAGLRVLLVDIDAQARGRPRMIEQASADTPAAQPGFDEEHLDMRLVQANEALGHAVVVDQHPDLDGRQVQVADLWVKLDDVRFTEKIVGRADGTFPQVDQCRVVGVDALANGMLDSFIRKIPGRTKGSRDRQAGRHAEVRHLDARGANQRTWTVHSGGEERERHPRRKRPVGTAALLMLFPETTNERHCARLYYPGIVHAQLPASFRPQAARLRLRRHRRAPRFRLPRRWPAPFRQHPGRQLDVYEQSLRLYRGGDLECIAVLPDFRSTPSPGTRAGPYW